MASWTVVVPVKSWDAAKNRLLVPQPLKQAFARAFAEDVLSAASASSRVGDLAVVTNEPRMGPIAGRAGARLLAEPEPADGEGLNSAIAAGLAWARKRCAGPVAVVPADLPCLTPTALDAVLELAGTQPFSFVPDTEGTGTTILCARGPDLLRTAYGAGSCARHADMGAFPMAQVDLRARQDVDNLEDLRAATRLGVGRSTAALVERHKALICEPQSTAPR